MYPQTGTIVNRPPEHVLIRIESERARQKVRQLVGEIEVLYAGRNATTMLPRTPFKYAYVPQHLLAELRRIPGVSQARPVGPIWRPVSVDGYEAIEATANQHAARLKEAEQAADTLTLARYSSERRDLLRRLLGGETVDGVSLRPLGEYAP